MSEREDVQRLLKDKVDIGLLTVQIPNLKSQITNKFQISNPKSQNCDYLKMQPKYSSKFSAFVPIGNGCDNFCTYCVVPNARGREVYRPAEDILDEVRGLVDREYKEIVLIAQNVNSYNSPFTPKNVKKRQKINFASLLKLVNNITGDFWIRFATSHPKDMSDELIQAMVDCSNPPSLLPSLKLRKSRKLWRARVCEHIHLPAQAGDNEILKKMNRNYTVEHYKKLIKKIRQAMPNASITTDIIVGFPGETKEQFNRTVKLFKEVKFDMAYISQYSSRPGTVAEKLSDNVLKEEKKRREQELMAVLRKTALENNEEYIGKIVDVLIEGRNKRGEWYGQTRTFKNVRFKIYDLRFKNIIGEFVKVKIKEARDFGLEGELAK